jgi:hypothetical protein
VTDLLENARQQPLSKTRVKQVPYSEIQDGGGRHHENRKALVTFKVTALSA